MNALKLKKNLLKSKFYVDPIAPPDYGQKGGLVISIKNRGMTRNLQNNTQLQLKKASRNFPSSSHVDIQNKDEIRKISKIQIPTGNFEIGPDLVRKMRTIQEAD